ncbi:Ras homolog gene family, member Q [Mytilus galloprovincialis]|uniref:Ras homolog gene family, member Q n=1 Tax=Mytilus galloprovincialis TaxID=29158 RepID=A0A8B6CMN8_MYTGA|nr:Ras homolog gene family, member Q [Mytilus galloprovincialis]
MVCYQNTVSCEIVGDGMVGKTCLSKRFAGSQFSDKYVATVSETTSGSVSAYGDKYNLNIHEHEEKSTRLQAITDADVIIVSYSSVDRESFENAKSVWVPEVRKLHKKKPIVLVATQSDIRDENNTDHVSDTEGQNLMKSIKADYYNKCSSATNDGVKNVFESVVCAAIRYRKKKTNVLKRVFER